jgi:hypothetical protein
MLDNIFRRKDKGNKDNWARKQIEAMAKLGGRLVL